MLLKEELAIRRGLPEIVGQDASLRQVVTMLRRAAGSDATVLLEGESGTGKELFARALHAFSSRVDGPFVAINCAALQETLLESELFDHEKGAFTGAVAKKPGKFEVAHRGTLFLDEIGDLPPPLQAKILRAIEGHRFERVGGTTPLHVDVRIVAATNKDLQAEVSARQFREDLYFRLSVFPITIPPLRDRPEDITILARYFIDRFCKDLKKPALALSSNANEALKAYSWPGNVRELQNGIERTVILCETHEIQPRHLNLTADSVKGEKPDDPWDFLDLSGTFDEASRRIHAEFERHKIVQVMHAAKGDTQVAAGQLRINHRDLLGKHKQYQLGGGKRR